MGRKIFREQRKNLVKYHEWLSTTGVKAGLISPKKDQYIWDEFIVHSLYFYKLIEDLNLENKDLLILEPVVEFRNTYIYCK